MTDDLVEVLRATAESVAQFDGDPVLYLQAADEIEQLRADRSLLIESVKQTKARTDQWNIALQKIIDIAYSEVGEPLDDVTTIANVALGHCETCGGRGEIGGAVQDGSTQTDPCPDCAPLNIQQRGT